MSRNISFLAKKLRLHKGLNISPVSGVVHDVGSKTRSRDVPSRTMSNVSKTPSISPTSYADGLFGSLVSDQQLTQQSNPNQTVTKKPDWNRAVSDAEKIVGYPTSYLSLRCLLSDEISNIAVHVRKLVGTSHPLLKTAKRLIYNGRNNMQTRGLIVLLLSKAAGHMNPEELEVADEQDKPAGVSHSQRSLAEITEMIHTAHLIHKGVVNLTPSDFPDGNTLQDMTFGNKIAILSGDYLLSNACTGLAALKNSKVVELISTSISDFMEAEFIGVQDTQSNAIPTKNMTMEEWAARNYLAAGSLMAKSCQATLVLAGHSEDMQQKGFEFGKQIAYSWQAHADLQPFLDLYRCPPGTQFDLCSAPVLLHCQQHPELLDYIQSCGDSIDNLDFKYLHQTIMQGPGVKQGLELCMQHARKALDVLADFERSDAREALENIIHAIMECD
ncbi:all trans-polyprenyl-diphosphate synthase PDSS2-like [Amphibalanus amphitrite]|uniref:all trans-polyprenyl-diphosphate synthase PDSS2-like n=1 Tax=Amphibalanus amphitrite TaxID=1232801 RepID=UPI001C905B5E|nr:all trans-polyprenyl-diphosphate synthase PDSS2-like [Amphibalanus amphitrite]